MLIKAALPEIWQRDKRLLVKYLLSTVAHIVYTSEDVPFAIIICKC